MSLIVGAGWISRYDNARLIADRIGLQRLRKQGQDVHLINGVHADSSAADYLIGPLNRRLGADQDLVGRGAGGELPWYSRDSVSRPRTTRSPTSGPRVSVTTVC